MIMIEIIKYLLMLLVVQHYQILYQLVHIIKDIFLNHNKIILDLHKTEKDVFDIKILVIIVQHQLIGKY